MGHCLTYLPLCPTRYISDGKRARRQIFRSCHENGDGTNHRLNAEQRVGWSDARIRARWGRRGEGSLFEFRRVQNFASNTYGSHERRRGEREGEGGRTAAKSIQSASSPRGYASVVPPACVSGWRPFQCQITAFMPHSMWSFLNKSKADLLSHLRHFQVCHSRKKAASAAIPVIILMLSANAARGVFPRYKRYQSQTGFQEWNFCHPRTEIFLKTSLKWEQLDQSDCLLWSAYEVWPIRLFVLLSLWTFRVTQALLLHDSYLSIWFLLAKAYFVLLINAAVTRRAAGDAISYFTRFLDPPMRSRDYDGDCAWLILTKKIVVWRIVISTEWSYWT